MPAIDLGYPACYDRDAIGNGGKQEHHERYARAALVHKKEIWHVSVTQVFG
jgi:hypothetical protein